MRCFACNDLLIPDHRPEDVEVLVNGEPNYDIGFDDFYQFDNALWIGFHGGYGMFTDNMEATLPHVLGVPANEATYDVKRKLPGQPDHECVLCHDCAHEACDALPWMKRLIDPWSSHAHTAEYTESHPDHYGWDYSIATQPNVRMSGDLVRPPEHEVPPAPWNSPTPEE